MTAWVKWVLGGAIVVGGAAVAHAVVRSPGITYPIDTDRPFGKVWGSRRPPGLPLFARHVSVEEAAYPFISERARALRLGENFERALLSLADNESSGTFARPANTFDARSGSSGYTSAYGVWQWNDDAWDRMGRADFDYIAPQFRHRIAPIGRLRTHVWEQTADEELYWPIEFYAMIWRTVVSEGGDEVDAARGIRIYHSGPGRFRRYRNDAESRGSWSRAWRNLGQELSAETAQWYRDKTRRIDADLRRWGVPV
ncbi:MAG: hypothetical protein ACYTG0_12670 [Planctomycetota bacterium]